MRMREDHCVHGLRIDRRRLPVSQSQIFRTLKESTIDKDSSIFGFKKELGAGDGLSSP